MSELTMKEILLLTASDGCRTDEPPSDCGDHVDCHECINSEDCRPRWTAGSLAAYVSEGSGHITCEAYADAVERLMRAARALLDSIDSPPGEWHDSDLRAAVEAAERWKP
jgi:hypothetical protein